MSRPLEVLAGDACSSQKGSGTLMEIPSFTGLEVLDPKHISQLDAMRVPGKGSLFEELVVIFRREAPPRVEALSIAVASHEAEKTAKLAHAMVGSLSTLGARQMQHAMRCLEAAASQGDWLFIESVHREVLDAWKRLLHALDSR